MEKNRKKDGNQLELTLQWIGIELEWKQNEKFSTEMILTKQNVIGMEMEWKIQNRNIQFKVERKGGGNGMEIK